MRGDDSSMMIMIQLSDGGIRRMSEGNATIRILSVIESTV